MASSNPQLNDVHQRNVKVLAQYKANLVDIDKTDAWKNAVDKLAVWLSDRRAYYLLALPLIFGCLDTVLSAFRRAPSPHQAVIDSFTKLLNNIKPNLRNLPAAHKERLQNIIDDGERLLAQASSCSGHGASSKQPINLLDSDDENPVLVNSDKTPRARARPSISSSATIDISDESNPPSPTLVNASRSSTTAIASSLLQPVLNADKNVVGMQIKSQAVTSNPNMISNGVAHIASTSRDTTTVVESPKTATPKASGIQGAPAATKPSPTPSQPIASLPSNQLGTIVRLKNSPPPAAVVPVPFKSASTSIPDPPWKRTKVSGGSRQDTPVNASSVNSSISGANPLARQPRKEKQTASLPPPSSVAAPQTHVVAPVTGRVRRRTNSPVNKQTSEDLHSFKRVKTEHIDSDDLLLHAADQAISQNVATGASAEPSLKSGFPPPKQLLPTQVFTLECHADIGGTQLVDFDISDEYMTAIRAWHVLREEESPIHQPLWAELTCYRTSALQSALQGSETLASAMSTITTSWPTDSGKVWVSIEGAHGFLSASTVPVHNSFPGSYDLSSRVKAGRNRLKVMHQHSLQGYTFIIKVSGLNDTQKEKMTQDPAAELHRIAEHTIHTMQLRYRDPDSTP